MGTLLNLALGLKAWLEDVDIQTTTTWFLLSFVYLFGISQGAPSVDFSTIGILPVLRVEMLNVTLAILCLVIAAVVFLEPLFPSTLQKGSKKVWNHPVWQYIYGLHLFAAFIVGLGAGLDFLIENLPTFSWLVNAVAYAGLVIIVAMALNMIVTLWSTLLRESKNHHG